MLYLVGTPIGNLSDLSPRALEVLSAVDAIACEDTRRTGLLLSKFDIKKKLISYHEHNRTQKGPILISMIESGLNLALVSDAGMPCISDPGEELVRECAQKNLPIQVIPGPVAAISALALSGLDTKRFIFEGFLPSDGKDRKERLQELVFHRQTFILYEAPHRILRTLEDLTSIGLGERDTAICREITKKYEEVLRMQVKDACDYFRKTPPRGEFVLVVAGGEPPCKEDVKVLTTEDRKARVSKLIEENYSTKEISQLLAIEWNDSRKNVYSFIIKMLQ
ncbi:MAG: 16S rRNA (cytidine(1402)-2'-O)-methyltransferase [Eubacteriales bacterium]